MSQDYYTEEESMDLSVEYVDAEELSDSEDEELKEGGELYAHSCYHCENYEDLDKEATLAKCEKCENYTCNKCFDEEYEEYCFSCVEEYIIECSKCPRVTFDAHNFQTFWSQCVDCKENFCDSCVPQQNDNYVCDSCFDKRPKCYYCKGFFQTRDSEIVQCEICDQNVCDHCYNSEVEYCSTCVKNYKVDCAGEDCVRFAVCREDWSQCLSCGEYFCEYCVPQKNDNYVCVDCS